MAEIGFVSILAVAVLLFAALLLLFGGPAPTAPIVPTEEKITALPTAITEEYRHISLAKDFYVSYTAKEELATELNGQVSNGLFGGVNKKIEFAIPTKQAVDSKVNFTVEDTNLYGKMIFALNGQEIFSNFSFPGTHTFNFPTSLIKETNVFEALAESSGWKIWAPTVYIFNSSLFVSYLGIEEKTFEFNLTDLELKDLTESRVVLFINKKEGEGNIIIKVNGNDVYRKSPKVRERTTTVIADFSSALLRLSNRVDLLTDPNTKYNIEEAEVIVFWS